MTELIAFLSSGEATRRHLIKLIENESWDGIFLITSVENKKDFLSGKNIEYIITNPEFRLPELIEDIKNKLKDRVIGPEVALNIISGTGKEHMALLSAILKLGLGIRLVAFTKEGVREV